MEGKFDISENKWNNIEMEHIYIEPEIYNDAIDQIFIIIDNPAHKNILGLVSKSKVIDMIDAMFDYGRGKSNRIISDMKNSGFVEEPIRGFLVIAPRNDESYLDTWF